MVTCLPNKFAQVLKFGKLVENYVCWERKENMREGTKHEFTLSQGIWVVPRRPNFMLTLRKILSDRTNTTKIFVKVFENMVKLVSVLNFYSEYLNRH